MSAATMTRCEASEIARDRRRQIRDRILCAIEDAGPMSPAELARRTGIGAAVVSLSAIRSPAYFRVVYNGKAVALVELHPHLARVASPSPEAR